MAATADSPAARRIGTLSLEPCTLSAPNSPSAIPAFCGKLPVAENRDAPAGRRIELAVALVPSRAKRPLPDPVFMLAGGPGQSALETYPAAAAAFRDVLRDRDVVLVDQRGTGGSHRLACPEPDAGAGADAFGDPSAARKFAEACLAGRVLELDGTTPNVRVSVEAVDRPNGPPLGPRADPDAEGRYTLSGLAAGQDVLVAVLGADCRVEVPVNTGAGGPTCVVVPDIVTGCGF